MTTSSDIARGITKNIAKEITGRVNLITNGGFENGTTGWVKQGAATIAEETGIVHSGIKSLKLTSAGSGALSVEQGIPTNIGDNYIANGWLYSATGNIVYLWIADTPFTIRISDSGTSISWVKYEVTFQANVTTTYIGMTVAGGAGAICYIDDVVAYKT